MFDILIKHRLYANLKKCCFLSYVILTQKVKIEDKKVKIIKNWLKLKSV